MNDIRSLIYQLETSLLQPETRASEEMLDRLLADDFIEFGTSGRVYRKQDTVEQVPKNAASYQGTFVLSDFEVRTLSSDCVLATYRSDMTYADGERVQALRSSIWKKAGDQWRMMFHQGTRASD